jgi:hypothetical protein
MARDAEFDLLLAIRGGAASGSSAISRRRRPIASCCIASVTRVSSSWAANSRFAESWRASAAYRRLGIDSAPGKDRRVRRFG